MSLMMLAGLAETPDILIAASSMMELRAPQRRTVEVCVFPHSVERVIAQLTVVVVNVCSCYRESRY
jgi:hypothetical protein